MSRAPFQVLVLPFIVTAETISYAILKREPTTGGYWQGIAGGGDLGESPLEAAKREAFEEAGIDPGCEYIELSSYTMVPVIEVVHEFKWGKNVLVIPEYCFGAAVRQTQLRLSSEHTEFRWLPYLLAREFLHWDSNKTALWELDVRLRRRYQFR